MVYDLFDNKEIKPNFLYENLVKLDRALVEHIFLPLNESLFSAGLWQVQKSFKDGFGQLESQVAGEGVKLSWYDNIGELEKIINSSR